MYMILFDQKLHNKYIGRAVLLQLNEYETVPYSIQLSQNLTSGYLLISVYFPVFNSSCMMWS